MNPMGDVYNPEWPIRTIATMQRCEVDNDRVYKEELFTHWGTLFKEWNFLYPKVERPSATLDEEELVQKASIFNQLWGMFTSTLSRFSRGGTTSSTAEPTKETLYPKLDNHYHSSVSLANVLSG